jgi:signal recognition particle receptor subunit beta
MGKHVVILGGFSAGKTSFIEAVSAIEIAGVAHWHEPIKKPISATFGATLIEDEEVFLFYAHTNLGRHMHWIGEDTDAIVIVIDSTNHINPLQMSFQSVRSLLKQIGQITHFNGSCLIAANKQDRSDALPPDALHAFLNLDENTTVYPCSTKDRDSVMRILRIALGLDKDAIR